jgi:hypothetical protein
VNPAVIRYPGSKWSLAELIVEQFQPHYHYVEPFFGSGAVFFSKPPARHEVINDRNALVVNFFVVLRDRTDELLWALEATPWSRDEYDQSHLLTGDPLDGDEAAEVGTSDNFDVSPTWSAVEPERPTPAEKVEAPPAVDVVSAMRKAASDNKASWAANGKPTKEDYAPAWALLSIRVGAPVNGPGDITADTLDDARWVLALGKEEVLKRLAEHAEQAAKPAAVEAEFEAEPESDDPFQDVT